MKKKYLEPAMRFRCVCPSRMMATSPGGVKQNSALGNEYSVSDESYVKEESLDASNAWDAEW